jgi:hypothetical protein
LKDDAQDNVADNPFKSPQATSADVVAYERHKAIGRRRIVLVVLALLVIPVASFLAFFCCCYASLVMMQGGLDALGYGFGIGAVAGGLVAVMMTVVVVKKFRRLGR